MSLIEVLYLLSSFIIFFGGIAVLRAMWLSVKELNTYWLSNADTSNMTCFKFYQAIIFSNLFASSDEVIKSKNKFKKSLMYFIGIVVFIFGVRNGFLQFVVSPTGL